MSETKIRTNNIITITPEALDTYGECITAIADAYKWATDSQVVQDMPDDFENYDKLEKEIEQRAKLAVEMELSFLRNWAHLMTTGQNYDGPLTIYRDMKCGFFWKFTNGKQPYHGGLIFHRNHSVKSTDIIGTWSIHT